MNDAKYCFVIMPISDQDGYEKGHFSRVYQHLIKPACEHAGFIPFRADDEVKTNYIVIDIIRKILDSEMVICDLSAKNPNVLYELGIRQAFNKKVVLIKDNKTNRIFDIQGLRTLDYDANLRVDEVQKNIIQISKTLTDTFTTKPEDINSLIQLLSIQPAVLPSQIEISKESSLILDTLSSISNRLSKLEQNFTKPNEIKDNSAKVVTLGAWEFKIGDTVYDDKTALGALVDVQGDYIFLKKDDQVKQYSIADISKMNIWPF